MHPHLNIGDRPPSKLLHLGKLKITDRKKLCRQAWCNAQFHACCASIILILATIALQSYSPARSALDFMRYNY
ncbi:hypothetical protein QUA43_12605 [Microcoleus sp. N9_B4]